jgi:hypothetical protein
LNDATLRRVFDLVILNSRALVEVEETPAAAAAAAVLQAATAPPGLKNQVIAQMLCYITC